jgi:hypothetical protein
MPDPSGRIIQARVVKAYTKRALNELSLLVGDEITVFDATNNTMWFGQMTPRQEKKSEIGLPSESGPMDQPTGWFPSANVVPLVAPPTPTHPSSMSSKGGVRLSVRLDNSTFRNQLTAALGDPGIVVGSEIPGVPSPRLRKHARAIHDYAAESPSELTIKAGDIISILSSNEEESWWEGELSSGQIGYFPKDFVQVFRDPTRGDEAPPKTKPIKTLECAEFDDPHSLAIIAQAVTAHEPVVASNDSGLPFLHLPEGSVVALLDSNPNHLYWLAVHYNNNTAPLTHDPSSPRHAAPKAKPTSTRIGLVPKANLAVFEGLAEPQCNYPFTPVPLSVFRVLANRAIGSVTSSEGQPALLARVNFEFCGENENEHEYLGVGDLVWIIDDDETVKTEAWVEVEIDTKRGFCPTSFLEILSDRVQAPKPELVVDYEFGSPAHTPHSADNPLDSKVSSSGSPSASPASSERYAPIASSSSSAPSHPPPAQPQDALSRIQELSGNSSSGSVGADSSSPSSKSSSKKSGKKRKDTVSGASKPKESKSKDKNSTKEPSKELSKEPSKDPKIKNASSTPSTPSSVPPASPAPAAEPPSVPAIVPGQPVSSSTATLARALYSYRAESESELTLNAGDIVRLIDYPPTEEWWEGILVAADGSPLPEDYIGFFPRDFVVILSNPEKAKKKRPKRGAATSSKSKSRKNLIQAGAVTDEISGEKKKSRSEITAQVDDLKAQLETNAMDLDIRQAELDTMSAELELTKIELNAKELENERQATEIEALKNERNVLQESYKELEKKQQASKSHTTQVEKQQLENEKLKAELAKMKARAESAEAQQATLREQVEQLTKQIETERRMALERAKQQQQAAQAKNPTPSAAPKASPPQPSSAIPRTSSVTQNGPVVKPLDLHSSPAHPPHAVSSHSSPVTPTSPAVSSPSAGSAKARVLPPTPTQGAVGALPKTASQPKLAVAPPKRSLPPTQPAPSLPAEFVKKTAAPAAASRTASHISAQSVGLSAKRSAVPQAASSASGKASVASPSATTTSVIAKNTAAKPSAASHPPKVLDEFENKRKFFENLR